MSEVVERVRMVLDLDKKVYLMIFDLQEVAQPTVFRDCPSTHCVKRGLLIYKNKFDEPRSCDVEVETLKLPPGEMKHPPGEDRFSATKAAPIWDHYNPNLPIETHFVRNFRAVLESTGEEVPFDPWLLKKPSPPEKEAK